MNKEMYDTAIYRMKMAEGQLKILKKSIENFRTELEETEEKIDFGKILDYLKYLEKTISLPEEK